MSPVFVIASPPPEPSVSLTTSWLASTPVVLIATSTVVDGARLPTALMPLASASALMPAFQSPSDAVALPSVEIAAFTA